MTVPVQVETSPDPGQNAGRRRRTAFGFALGAVLLAVVLLVTTLSSHDNTEQGVRALSDGVVAPLPAETPLPSLGTGLPPGASLPPATVPGVAVSNPPKVPALPGPSGSTTLPPAAVPSTAVTVPTLPSSPPTTGQPGSNPIPPGDPVGQPADAMEVRPTVDRGHYAENEGVVITADVCNTAPEEVQFYVYPGQELLFYIRDESGKRISGATNPALAAGRWVAWAPGQCRRYVSQQSWWHDGWAEKRPHGFPMVRAGRYRAEAQFAGQPPKRPEQIPWNDGTTGVSEHFDLDGVTVVVTADKPRYTEGETVHLNAKVCNPTSRPQTQTFRWSPRQDVRVMLPDYTQSVATLYPNDGPSAPYQQTWGPGECINIPYAWNQGERIAEGPDGGPLTDARRGPGIFAVEIVWYGRVLADDTSDPGFIPYRFPDLLQLA